MAETVKDFPDPAFEQVWQALRILYGPTLKAATVTVLRMNGEKTLFTSSTYPDTDKDRDG